MKIDKHENLKIPYNIIEENLNTTDTPFIMFKLTLDIFLNAVQIIYNLTKFTTFRNFRFYNIKSDG